MINQFKIRASREVLLGAIAPVMPVIQKSSIAVLEHLQITTQGEELTVVGSSLERSIVFKTILSSGYQSEKGAICIPARGLMDTLRGLPEKAEVESRQNRTNVQEAMPCRQTGRCRHSV